MADSGQRLPTLFVSVGHTAHSKVNSGIQRVTRSIAKEVLNRYEDADLLEWYLKKNRYILLDEVAREKLSHFSGPPYHRLDGLLKRERAILFSLLSEDGESGWEKVFGSIVRESHQAEFLANAGTLDRLKMRLLLRWLRKRRLRLRELEIEEKTIQGSFAAEIEKRMKSIRASVESLLQTLGEGADGLPFSRHRSKRDFTFSSEAEAAALEPIVADPFLSWTLVRVPTDELTRYFEELVGRLDRSGFRPLNWVSLLPVPRFVRRKLRRCIRIFDNARQEAADRKLIRSFTDKVIVVRLTLDRFRSRQQKLLDLKSDCESDLFAGLFEIQLMQGNSLEESIAEDIRACMEQVGRLRRRLYPRQFVPPKGSWVLIPELMTSGEFQDVFYYAKQHELRVAVVFHHALPIQFPELVSKRYRDDHEQYMRAIAQADCLLPVSEYSKTCYLDWANRVGVEMPRIEVCLNGVQFSERTAQSADLKLPDAVPNDFALCVSTIEPRKNHLKLLEAWKQLTSKGESLPQLVLVGNAYSGFEDLAEQVDQICSAEEGITWLRGVDDETLETLYSRCRFTVFPSIAEGFGLPILESIWYGRPCLCANFGAMEEAAQGGGCLRVDMRSVDAIERGIREIALDAALLASLEAECRQRTLRTWSDYAEQLGRILEVGDHKAIGPI